ncbi:MAG: hypothetical protein GY719_28835 [bacterium]|nr:hypothetical protein [bacterium]
MGFLKRLLGGSDGDPRRDIERAETLLAKGEIERALELAERAAGRGSPSQEQSAADVARRARRALVDGALEKAALAESSEYFEDAAEWLETAIEHLDDEPRRAELTERRAALLTRAEEAEQEAPWEPPPEADVEPGTEVDPDSHYMALVDMFRESAAELYTSLPAAFRRAYVDLNEGRPEKAMPVLDDLADGAEDPVLHFERGRCRLMLGDAEGAVDDLETAWEAFGDEPLDRVGELSVPGFWADAMLGLGRGRQVIERLGDLADPAADNPALSEIYGEALLAENRLDEARRFLTGAAIRYPSRPAFSHQLAMALGRSGERAAAIDCLEASIAPSCASGGCAKPPKHLPSIRFLASLYLDQGGHADRVHQLMTLVAQALRGRLGGEDHSLLGKYYDEIGDPEAAEHARSEARRLRDAGSAAGDLEAAPALGGAPHKRAPL